jgi:translation initiation factor IF-3
MLNKPYRPRLHRPEDKYKSRTNEQITAPEVRVIGSDNQQLGVMPTAKALALAREQNFDLVEVSPKSAPPVVKLINYDKYRYQQMKQMQAQKKHQKNIDVKGIRLSIRTGAHDMEFKARSSEKFLKEGDKVKVDLVMRGREQANVQYAFDQFRKFLSLITCPYTLEVQPKKLGNTISAIVAPGLVSKEKSSGLPASQAGRRPPPFKKEE